MARKYEDIFHECLEGVLKGQPIEEWLARYPEHASELEPLLRMALATARASRVEPRPEFKAATRYRVMSALGQAAEPKRHGFGWSRRWAVAVAALFIISSSGIGTVLAADQSLPGEPLYQVKMTREQTELALARDEVSQARLNVKFAQKRVAEMERLAEKADLERFEELALKLASHVEKVEQASLQSRDVAQAQELKNAVDEGAKEQLIRLQGLLKKAPESARGLIIRAINGTWQRYDKALRSISNLNSSRLGNSG